MSTDPIAPEDEMALAEAQPQTDASSLVDRELLSGRALKERTRCNVELGDVRANDYDFVSERALDACSTYEVESISLGAAKAA